MVREVLAAPARVGTGTGSTPEGCAVRTQAGRKACWRQAACIASRTLRAAVHWGQGARSPAATHPARLAARPPVTAPARLQAAARRSLRQARAQPQVRAAPVSRRRACVRSAPALHTCCCCPSPTTKQAARQPRNRARPHTSQPDRPHARTRTSARARARTCAVACQAVPHGHGAALVPRHAEPRQVRDGRRLRPRGLRLAAVVPAGLGVVVPPAAAAAAGAPAAACPVAAAPVAAGLAPATGCCGVCGAGKSTACLGGAAPSRSGRCSRAEGGRLGGAPRSRERGAPRRHAPGAHARPHLCCSL